MRSGIPTAWIGGSFHFFHFVNFAGLERAAATGFGGEGSTMAKSKGAGIARAGAGTSGGL